MKQLLEGKKKQYESYFKSEIHRVKEEWAQQRIIEVAEYVNTTKQQLDEKFSTVLQTVIKYYICLSQNNLFQC